MEERDPHRATRFVQMCQTTREGNKHISQNHTCWHELCRAIKRLTSSFRQRSWDSFYNVNSSCGKQMDHKTAAPESRFSLFASMEKSGHTYRHTLFLKFAKCVQSFGCNCGSVNDFGGEEAPVIQSFCGAWLFSLHREMVRSLSGKLEHPKHSLWSRHS